MSTDLHGNLEDFTTLRRWFWLDLARRSDSPSALRQGHELLRVYD